MPTTDWEARYRALCAAVACLAAGIEDQTGASPAWFLPPKGEHHFAALEAAITEHQAWVALRAPREQRRLPDV